MPIARLGDPHHPEEAVFMFRKGERVAWRRSDGVLDPEYRGAIVDGFCDYTPGGGAYRTYYIVERADKQQFAAEGHLDLERID